MWWPRAKIRSELISVADNDSDFFLKTATGDKTSDSCTNIKVNSVSKLPLLPVTTKFCWKSFQLVVHHAPWVYFWGWFDLGYKETLRVLLHDSAPGHQSLLMQQKLTKDELCCFPKHCTLQISHHVIFTSFCEWRTGFMYVTEVWVT
jgi:hypothetical protein